MGEDERFYIIGASVGHVLMVTVLWNIASFTPRLSLKHAYESLKSICCFLKVLCPQVSGQLRSLYPCMDEKKPVWDLSFGWCVSFLSCTSYPCVWAAAPEPLCRGSSLWWGCSIGVGFSRATIPLHTMLLVSVLFALSPVPLRLPLPTGISPSQDAALLALPSLLIFGLISWASWLLSVCVSVSGGLSQYLNFHRQGNTMFHTFIPVFIQVRPALINYLLLPVVVQATPAF